MAKTSAQKSRGKTKIAALMGEKLEPKADGGQIIDLEEEVAPDPLAEQGISISPETGSVHIKHADESITIDPDGDSLNDNDPQEPTEHYDNLADRLDAFERSRIVERLIEAIDNAKQERRQWEQMRAKCLDLLGMKLEDPKANVTTSALGMSTSVVRDPILLEAVEQFCATSFGELCPAGGPVKAENDDEGNKENDELAQALEDDLNYFLTPGGVATEYYPDTRHMLWWTGLTSGTFKKVYRCPKRRRPVSEYVNGVDLIVSSSATDLHNAGLIAHQSTMRPELMKWMQYEGVYRDVTLGEPLVPQTNAVDQKVANIEGIQAQSQRAEDQDYTIYECYCELDLKGFEHEDDGKLTGLPLPYRVTFEEGSREMLAIVRNWEEEDPHHNAKIPFVPFSFSTGLNRIYGAGLGQMGGNLAQALTALMRITIDAGMMSVYPGLLKAKGTGRQLVNEIRVPPGGCAEIDTGGLPIQQTVMGMPYTPPNPVIIQFAEQMREVARRVLGSANIPVGEGTADVPVGTIIAQVEQATKIIGAVHKALHASQDEELQLLRNLFLEDPAALWRGDKRGRRWALGQDEEQRKAKFIKALNNCLIRPKSDPNIPSQTHRMLIASWLMQVAQAPLNPLSPINQVEAIKRAAKMIGIDDIETMLNPPVSPQAPPPDPKAIAAMITANARLMDSQTKKEQLQLTNQQKDKDRALKGDVEAMKLAGQASGAETGGDPHQAALLALKNKQLNQDKEKTLFDNENKRADREVKLSVEAMKIAQVVGVHPEADGVVDNQLNQMSGLITPAKDGMAEGGAVAGEDNAQTIELYQQALHDIAEALVQIYEQQNAKPSREPMPFTYSVN